MRMVMNQRQTQVQFQLAVQRAYRRFAEQYPCWANSLFDEYFLDSTAAPILAAVYKQDRWPVAYELALAWSAQMDGSVNAKTFARADAALSVASAFLGALQAEWSNQTKEKWFERKTEYGTPTKCY